MIVKVNGKCPNILVNNTEQQYDLTTGTKGTWTRYDDYVYNGNFMGIKYIEIWNYAEYISLAYIYGSSSSYTFPVNVRCYTTITIVPNDTSLKAVSQTTNNMITSSNQEKYSTSIRLGATKAESDKWAAKGFKIQISCCMHEDTNQTASYDQGTGFDPLATINIAAGFINRNVVTRYYIRTFKEHIEALNTINAKLPARINAAYSKIGQFGGATYTVTLKSATFSYNSGTDCTTVTIKFRGGDTQYANMVLRFTTTAGAYKYCDCACSVSTDADTTYTIYVTGNINKAEMSYRGNFGARYSSSGAYVTVGNTSSANTIW